MRMLRRLVRWRVGVVWFGVGILLIPLAEIVTATALGSPDALAALTPSALVSYPAAYAVHFFFGPLFEESGWRGFALPRYRRYRASAEHLDVGGPAPHAATVPLADA